MSRRTLYVGNLPGDIRQREVEDLFYKYGPIVHIDLKVPRNPPGFAFVEFMDARDADDAIRGRDGYDFDGHRLRVELAHGGRGTSSSRDRFSGGRGGPHGRVSRRSDYRVLVTGLPSSASPQDLKDHMCKAGDVCFSQVFREGKETTGIADYTNYDDMRYAIRKLDETEFQNTLSRGYIRVKEYDSRQSRSQSRTSSRSRSKSPKAIFSRRSISLSKSASPRSGTKRGSLSRKMVGIRHSIREHTPQVENEKTYGVSVIIAFCDMVGTVLRMNGFSGVVLTPQILLDINCADLVTAIAFATHPDLGFETISSYPFVMISRNLSAWTERNYQVSRKERYFIDDIKCFYDPEVIKSEILANFGDTGKKYPLMGIFLTNEFKSREVAAAAAAADGVPFRHKGAIPHHPSGFGSRHGVVIVGVDTTSLNPQEHFVEVKSSYGRRWGRGGFSKVAFEEFECVLVPHYG